MGKLSDWEKVRPDPLGSGGQSEVFLVRRPTRRAAREKSFEVLTRLSGQGFNDRTALEFANASLDVSREDDPTELGALKVFNPRAAGEQAEEQALGRMRNEIEILKQNRPGLLKLLDSNEYEHWIVTEYCHLGTLDRHLPRYKGNPKLALKSFLHLVQTVAELHKTAVIHRDIKPQNIFVADQHELLLGDFGIVFLPNQADRLSFTGESVGPRDFMPPWVLMDDLPTITPAFDVYMLGKVLWCMVSGRLRLHREDFLDTRFDLTKLYPGDPDMHVVNKILSKCVVSREKDCLASAQELFLMVGGLSEIVQRGGQLTDDDIPRPCRVCGKGFYRPEESGSSPASIGTQITNPTGQHVGSIWFKLLTCDFCRHVQLFRDKRL